MKNIPIATVREMQVSKSVGGVWHVWAGDDIQVMRVNADALELRRYGRVVSSWKIPATGDRRRTINALFKELDQLRQQSAPKPFYSPSGGRAA